MSLQTAESISRQSRKPESALRPESALQRKVLLQTALTFALVNFANQNEMAVARWFERNGDAIQDLIKKHFQLSDADLLQVLWNMPSRKDITNKPEIFDFQKAIQFSIDQFGFAGRGSARSRSEPAGSESSQQEVIRAAIQ